MFDCKEISILLITEVSLIYYIGLDHHPGVMEFFNLMKKFT
jgi:hypothetical protein